MTKTGTSKAPAAKPAKAAVAKRGTAVPRKNAAAKAPAAAPKANGISKPEAAPVKKDAKPAPKAKPEAEMKEKPRKAKLVRDSFTMPEAEYAVLGDVKKACLKMGIDVKKSELLRVGVALIRQLDTARLKEVLASLPALKAGRPKKGK